MEYFLKNTFYWQVCQKKKKQNSWKYVKYGAELSINNDNLFTQSCEKKLMSH